MYDYNNRPLKPELCQKRIYEGFGTYWHQCSRKPQDGKAWCKQHDPELIRQKDAVRIVQREAEWEKEKQKIRLDRARQKATEGLTIEELNLVTPDLIRDIIQRGKQ